MKASELITELQKAINEHGDLEIAYYRKDEDQHSNIGHIINVATEDNFSWLYMERQP